MSACKNVCQHVCMQECVREPELLEHQSTYLCVSVFACGCFAKRSSWPAHMLARTHSQQMVAHTMPMPHPHQLIAQPNRIPLSPPAHSHTRRRAHPAHYLSLAARQVPANTPCFTSPAHVRLFTVHVWGQVFGGVGVWAVMQRPEAAFWLTNPALRIQVDRTCSTTTAFWLTNPALRIQVASGPPTLLARTMPLCSLVDPGLVSGPSGCKDMMR